MENASKALIIAGSILIALMIIGAVILMFNSLSNYQNMNDKDVKETQIVKFNNQYETYNRDNVRGSDLYSLLNRVADYNRRKSTVGIEINDEGVDSKFQPMTIIVGFKTKQNRQGLSYDTSTNYLFKDSFINNPTNQTFIIDEKRTNTFEKQISNEISSIENSSRYKKSGIQNLALGISKLDINASSDRKEKLKAIDLYNNNVNAGGATESNIIGKKDSIMNDVKIYYEYIQFKRAYFDCSHTEYNQNTGRITSMTFEFNGKFE